MRTKLVIAVLGSMAMVGTARADDPPPVAGDAARSAVAPVTPVARATVLHVPVASAMSGEAIELVAAVDGAWAEPALIARYRPMGAGAWREASFERSSAGGWYATIPADAVTPPGAEYYIVGVGGAGEAAHFASADAPQPIRVEPTVVDRLADLDRRRTGGRTETVTFDLDAHDFGNRYGRADWFARSELRWTHRISSRLYSIGFGFGVIQGRTPDREGAGAMEQVTAGRYGVAEVRLRPHASVFVDARVALGVSHAGFLRGLGGAITFGKPWRSNVSVGGEVLDELGPSAYVRLQWDTAPPLLMGAAVVRTDLPGALIDVAGLYLRYDVRYRVRPALAVRGSASYGSRDGAAHLGGGLGIETTF